MGLSDTTEDENPSNKTMRQVKSASPVAMGVFTYFFITQLKQSAQLMEDG